MLTFLSNSGSENSFWRTVCLTSISNTNGENVIGNSVEFLEVQRYLYGECICFIKYPSDKLIFERSGERKFMQVFKPGKMRGERYKMGLYELGVVNERGSEN